MEIREAKKVQEKVITVSPERKESVKASSTVELVKVDFEKSDSLKEKFEKLKKLREKN